MAFRVLEFLILARVLMSWIPNLPYNTLTRFIYETTEPILAPFRRLMPRGAMPFDFSPILAFLVLGLVEQVVMQILFGLFIR